MDNKEFRRIINQGIKTLNLKKVGAGWITELNETIIGVILRKSGYGNQYYLILKVNIGTNEKIDKEWLKHDVADVLLSIDSENKECFDLENAMFDIERESKLKELMVVNLRMKIEKLSTKKGIVEMFENEGLFLLPNTKEKLSIKNKK